MRRTDTAPAGYAVTIARIAWWACVAALLALLLLFLLARPAAASTLGRGQAAGPLILVPSENEGEDESEDEELEAEEEEEGEEEEEEEAREEEGLPPVECVLETARAQAFAYPTQNKLRLLIHYTATEPTEAMVEYRLKGGKGSLRLGEAKQHLDRAGLIRVTDNLGAGAMSKASAAKSVTVELHIPDTPSSCRHFDIRHLKIEHETDSRVTWLQSESVFGALGDRSR
jgi:hypothetical protein